MKPKSAKFSVSNLSNFLTMTFVTVGILSGCAKDVTKTPLSQPGVTVLAQRDGKPPQPVLDDESEKTPGANPAPSPLTTETTQIPPEMSPIPAKKQIFTVQFQKSFLNQAFFYEADLQYSSIYEKDLDLYSQSLTLGLIPSKFVVVGAELRLMADNRRLFPSDVNHPDPLLSRFKIIAENETTLTVEAGNSGLFLTEILAGKKMGAPRDTWMRSFEAPEGKLVLQETSVLLADGTQADFLESIFPQESLKPGEQFEKFEMNPKHPTGAFKPKDLTNDFMLLAGESVYTEQGKSEKKVAFAQHFDISGGKTIDWYVTRNAPEKYLPALKTSIEGWNRYFLGFKGIEREVVRFLGKLPEGVKLGDPRYNIVNWDSRNVAGAAYESQASDPFTGNQSHSLVYLPAAWLDIGAQYWANGQYSDAEKSVSKKALARNEGLTKVANISCLRDVRDAALTAVSGRLLSSEVEDFAVELLKGVIFHEIGHALGLGHNFKGSLSYDPADKNSQFSSSIMDYNNYELERKAFASKDAAEGPQLEYDRRALSAIYNKRADLTQEQLDKPMPACNDELADSENGDVDPLCVRYDLEKDPTQSVVTAWERVTLDKREGDVTLIQAVARAGAASLTASALSEAKNEEAFKSLAGTAANAVKGAMRFYYLQNSGSLARTVRTNVKSLLNFSKESLLAGYDSVAMRERVFDGVQKTTGTFELSPSLKTALETVKNSIVEALKTSAYIQALDPAKAQVAIATTQIAVNAVIDSFVRDEEIGLPRMRAVVLAALARHKTIPFFAGKLGANDADFQTAIISLLADAGGESVKRGAAERLAAVKALLTFKGRLKANEAIEGVTKKVLEERAIALDATKREIAEQILSLISGGGTEAAK